MKWEYAYEQWSFGSDFAKRLNEAGEKGWELVSTTMDLGDQSFQFFYKRPKNE